MKIGRVILAGVGPGDPELLTIKAMNAIKQADCVIYDRLISDEVLELVSDEAEMIYVGKESDKHSVKQEEINRLLVLRALQGKNTVRIKGGDPFLFGRGGEEAEELAAAGIPFEIIPGITSAIAVPAYAGIPITHRDYCSSLHIITGHERPDKEGSNLDYNVLAKLQGTLVFLMGVSNISNIAASLVKYGKNPNTPVAVIEKGTTSSQRTVKGVLKTIVSLTEENKIESPSVIVIGEVVNLSEKLEWFMKGELKGKKILVTRTREQVSKVSKLLTQNGAKVMEFPLIKIEKPDNYHELDKAITEIERFQWLVFTSVNGVNAFFSRLKNLRKDIRNLSDIKLCAVGKATREALEELMLNVPVMPDNYTTMDLLNLLREKVDRKDNVLMARSDIAEKDLAEGLREYCNEVVDIVAYKTIDIEDEKSLELKNILKDGLDYITFASSSAVNCFSKLIEVDLIKKQNAVCIGPVTEQAAISAGFENILVADTYTVEGLVEKLIQVSKSEK